MAPPVETGLLPRPLPEAGDGARSLLVVALVALTFGLDLLLPLGYAAGVLYILPVLVSLGGRSLPLTSATAAAGGALTVIGYLLSPTGVVPIPLVLFNRGLSLFALVAVSSAVVAKQRADRERLASALALAHSEERFRIAFDYAPTGIAIQSPDGRFMEVNSAAAEMLGYPAEELVGRPAAEIVHPDDRDRLRAAQTGPLAEHGYSRIEMRFVRRDGGIVGVQLSLALVRAPDGTPLYVIAQGQDVTAQRAAEAALRESEERFRIAFGQAPTGIAVRARDGSYLQVNESLARMLGRPAEAFIGRCPWHFAAPEDAEVLRARDRTLLTQGDHARTPCRFLDAAHQTVQTRLTSSLVTTSEGQPLYFVDQVEDVTRELAEVERHRKLEEQLRRAQKLEAVGRLAGGIAHDFNNMLSIILNYATLAERRLGPESPAQPDLAAIRDAGMRAATLTRQLLLFAGRHAAAPRPIPIDPTVANIAQLLRRTLGEDIEVIVRLQAQDAHVLADASHLEQVLMNLGVNARDAMPEGGRLVITTGVVDGAPDDGLAPGQRVAITVSDTGAGMPVEVQARVFEPFYTTKAVGEGTGLGLAIVYGIIEQAGGHIELQSELGRGTTFRILLPAREAPAERPAGEPPSATPPRGRGEWVLVVEDEPALRTLTARLLSGRGYNVLAARDGVDALEALERHSGPLDLLLTDVVMPRMSGRELAARVAALRPGVRVLYVSGHAEDRIARHRLLHAGAALLSKPFHMDELLRRVRDALDGAESPGTDHQAAP